MMLTLMMLLTVVGFGTSEIQIRSPRIAMPDLVRSWSWLDERMASADLELDERRELSKRLDGMTLLFFQNDLGRVARMMDEIALELTMGDEVTDMHRSAAALRLEVREDAEGARLTARWRYPPPPVEGRIPMTLMLSPREGEPRRIDLVMEREAESAMIRLEEPVPTDWALDETIGLQLRLDDGTHLPQQRWTRQVDPFSRSRGRFLRALDDLDASQAGELFRGRAARLIDRVSPMDLTGQVLDRNRLRRQLAEELAAIQRGEDPYRNRIGDVWLDLPVGESRLPLRMYVPDSAAGSTDRRPVVVALHGAGGNEHFFLDGCGDGAIRTLADRHGIIVVCPSTYVMASSEAPLGALITFLTSNQNADPDRIYLLGHSLGGMTAVALAARRPDLIAGLVAIAGGAPFSHRADFPPVLAYAAERDPIVSGDLIETSARAARTAGARVILRRPEGTGHLTIVADVLEEAVAWLMTLGQVPPGTSPERDVYTPDR